MGLKSQIRDFAGQGLRLAKITHPGKRHAGQLLIATFHRVLPETERRRYPYPGLVVTPEELYWFLSYFKQHYICSHVGDIHHRYCQGERPDKPFMAITFDDGQLDNYQHARPVLADLGIKASFFIPVKHIEDASPIWHDQLGFAVQNATKTHDQQSKLQTLLADHGINNASGRWIGTVAAAAKKLSPTRRAQFVAQIDAIGDTPGQPAWAALMTWSQIRVLANDGHEIGSHSMTHALLPQCDDEAMAYEFSESKRILEKRIQHTIDSFCYPNGDHDNRTIAAAKQAGYLRAVTTQWGTNFVDTDDFALYRCDMDAIRVRNSQGHLSEALLALRLSGLHPGLKSKA